MYALHVFPLIRKAHPNALLTVYSKAYNRALLESTGCLDRIINNSDELDRSYDLVINLRGDWDTFRIASRSKMRLERGCVRLMNKIKGFQTHEVETNYRIIAPILPEIKDMPLPELHVPEHEYSSIDRLLKEKQVTRFALIHTGARDIARRWSAENFAELADWLHDAFDLKIVFGGGPDETGDIDIIREKCRYQTFNFAGLTSLLGFGALCSRATIFIGNESGPMHIANVMNTPLVALFGPGVKDVFYPYGNNVKVIHHIKKRKHTSQGIEDSTMKLITLDEVKNAVTALLARD